MDIKDVTTDQIHLGSGLIGRAGVRFTQVAAIQGVSPDWGDEYVALYEQDLDLTEVPAGRYAFFITTNPNRKIEEASCANNAAAVYLTLENEKVVVAPEKVASHE